MGALLLTVLLSQLPEGTIVEDELRRARNEYAYGQYEQAANRLHRLLYPMALYSDEQVVEARKYLALSYYLVGNSDAAREEFTKLLYLSPDFELDPYTIAPRIIDLFEEVRREHKEHLDVIRNRTSQKKLEEPLPSGKLRTIEKTRVERSDLASIMPFGIGQFANEDTGWGLFFAITQGALVAVNLGSYLYRESLAVDRRGQRGYPDDKSGTVQALTLAQYGSLTLFGIAYSFGVFHARQNFVPTYDLPPVVTEEELTTGASLTFRF